MDRAFENPNLLKNGDTALFLCDLQECSRELYPIPNL